MENWGSAQRFIKPCDVKIDRKADITSTLKFVFQCMCWTQIKVYKCVFLWQTYLQLEMNQLIHHADVQVESINFNWCGTSINIF